MLSFSFILILLVLIGLACAVVWATRKVLGALKVPDPFSTIVYVVVVLLCIFAIADYVLGGGGGFHSRIIGP